MRRRQINLHDGKFTKKVDEIVHRMDIGELADRQYRLLNIHLAIIEHVLTCRERPLWDDIYRLEDLILHEELTDSHPDKVTREEYPIFSDEQLARRQEGKHVKSGANTRIEVPLEIASEVGIDGRNHRYPSRRKRGDRENRFVDDVAKSRNKERAALYDAFIHSKDTISKTDNNGNIVESEIKFIRKRILI